MTNEGNTRITQIDGLRGIAALVVMGFHLTTRYDQLYHHAQPLPFRIAWGFVGVQLFFAISGFVILMTLRNAKAPMDFVVSRFSRLYPTYWACLLLTAALLLLFPLPQHAVTGPQVAGNLLMFHGLFGVVDVNGAYWTLKVELIFYALMLLLWTFGLLKRPLLPVIVWLAGALASRFVEAPWLVQLFGLLDWIPWFAIGIAVYVFAGKHDDYKLTPVVLLLSAVAIAKSDGVWLVGLAALVTALMYAAAVGKLKGAGSKVLLFLGAISYPLYLLHEYPSYSLMMRAEAAGMHSIVAVAMAAIACLALAYAVHVYAETTAMKWIRDRYKKRVGSNLMLWRAGIISVIALLAIAPRFIG